MKEDPFPTYEGLVEYLKDLPATWYPALILEMVDTAHSKRVFVKNGAQKLVACHEERKNKKSTRPVTHGGEG